MRAAVIGAGVILSTALWLAALSVGAPFDAANGALDRAFGGLPAWTQVRNMYRNPETQEASAGEKPLASFHRLAGYWAHGGRVLFIGNSQMQMVSLARGEAPPTGPEKTWVDLVTDELAKSGSDLKAYRLSAGGMTYAEALWDILYLTAHPELKPQAIFLQMNYQFLWSNGIRDGMLELLDDPAFRDAAAREAARGDGYSGLFRERLQAGAARGATAGAAPSTEANAPAERLESEVRQGLSGWIGFRERGRQRDDFLNLLYRARIYFLHLKPSTARSISEVRLRESQTAVERIAEICREENIRFVLLRVPANPLISLYRTPEDHDRYMRYLADMASRFATPVYDFEDLVPAQEWGLAYNGPDPLHMGRAGHRLLASRVIPIVELEMAAKP